MTVEARNELRLCARHDKQRENAAEGWGMGRKIETRAKIFTYLLIERDRGEGRRVTRCGGEQFQFA